MKFSDIDLAGKLNYADMCYIALPLTGRAGGGRCRGRDIIPGWSTEVEPFRQVSNECHKVWVAADKPRQGEVHTNKLMSHAQFRHAVRRAKRANKLQQAKGLVQPWPETSS